MTQHRCVADALALDVYFADPYSPWQRGSNEHVNGMIRRWLPKGSDLSIYSQEDLNAIAHNINTMPRKTLYFQTPQEVFTNIAKNTSKQKYSVALHS